jgi:hypothetical protein
MQIVHMNGIIEVGRILLPTLSLTLGPTRIRTTKIKKMKYEKLQ